MTLLAQPNDCHSCNDARSIVQKNCSKKSGLKDEPPRTRTWQLAAKKKGNEVERRRAAMTAFPGSVRSSKQHVEKKQYVISFVSC